MTPEPRTYLSQNDTIMWTVEDDPLLRSTIVAVVLLEHAPVWADLVARVDHASRMVPELREKVVTVPGHPGLLRWVPEPDLDLEYHLRRMAVPAPGRLSDVLQLARSFAASGFDRSKPLWEFTLIEGVMHRVDGIDVEGGAAFVMKSHHVVTDGVGAMQLASHLFDLSADAPIVPAAGGSGNGGDSVESHAVSAVEVVRDALGRDLHGVASTLRRALPALVPTLMRALRDPLHAAVETCETAASIGRTVAPVAARLSPIMTERHLGARFDVLDVPLDDLQRAAHAAGCTLNDAFLDGITGGLRRYHEAFDVEVEELRVAMPISIRSSDDPVGGNHVTVMRFTVPVGVEEPEERMRRLHEIGRHSRAERSLPHTEAIAGGLNLLPVGVIGSMLKKVDFLASNVSGVPVPMWLCGAQVERFYPFGPTAGSAVNVTLMSYDGCCCIGVDMDTAAITDPALFMRCLSDGFAEVVAVGTPPGR
ncbi:MAG: wax ester/triacylglycerol synthase domain-containing protein [Ilumatobacteraceae bacterium]